MEYGTLDGGILKNDAERQATTTVQQISQSLGRRNSARLARIGPTMTDFAKVNERIEKLYDHAVKNGQNEFQRVLMYDPARTYLRFHELSRFLGDIERLNLKILDVGCGNGEFVKYLNFHGFRGSYQGIDLNANLISEATQRFPGVRFECKNILADPTDSSDAVVMSGIFNADCGQTVQYIEAVVAAAFSMAREKVIFNAITTYVTYRTAEMFYLDPADAIAIAARLSGRFEIRHGFLPYNYTVCIHRSDHWHSMNS